LARISNAAVFKYFALQNRGQAWPGVNFWLKIPPEFYRQKILPPEFLMVKYLQNLMEFHRKLCGKI